MNGYVWYSYGSDSTGPQLAKALGFGSGKKTPSFVDYDLVVGWGCKPGEKYQPDNLAEMIRKRKIRVLNHPDAVRKNRNKLASLRLMEQHDICIPGFVYKDRHSDNTLFMQTLRALEKGELDFPLLGLNEFHKGYPVFCYTVEDITRAVENKDIQYFRSFCPGNEFKIYVFRDTVIAAETKMLAENPQKKLSEHLMRKLKRRAQKEEVKLQTTEGEINWIADELARELISGPNHMQRSVTHGWDLIGISLDTVPPEAMVQAIDAIEAVGLDMGAVSVTCEEKVARVTSVTSAPGLSGDQMDLFVSSIKEFAEAEKASPKRISPKKKTSAEDEGAPKELIARLRKKMSGLSRKKATEVLKTLGE